MKSKRLISGVLAVCMTVGLMTGCKSGGNDSVKNLAPDKNSAEYAAYKEANYPSNESDYVKQQWEKWNIGKDIKLDWFLGVATHTYLKDWSEYSILNDVVKITGVSPKIDVPAGDVTERMNIMITMDDWPDMMTVNYGDPVLDTLVSSGQVYCLEDLAKEYNDDWMETINPQLKSDSSSDVDGKLYGIPGAYLLPFLCESKDGVGAYTYNVRQDIYEELGSPDITTLDGFYNALKAFKQKYPKMNGKTTIPLHLGTNGAEGMTTLRYSFGVEDLYVHDGKAEPYIFNPKYKEFLMFMNKLTREGLVDPDALLKDKTSADQELATRTFMMPSYFWYLDAANATLAGEKNPTRYISVEPLNNTGTDKVRFPGLSRLGATMTIIPKKSSNPKAAYMFLKYMLSEDGNMLMLYGHEGTEWNFVEKENEKGEKEKWIQRTPAVQEQWTNNYTQYLEETGMFTFTYAFLKPYPEIGMEHPSRMKYDRPLANKYCFDTTLYSYKMAPVSTSAEGIASQKSGDIVDKSTYDIVTASSEAEASKLFDQMIKEVKAVPDYGKVLTFINDRYQKNVQKFGEERY